MSPLDLRSGDVFVPALSSGEPMAGEPRTCEATPRSAGSGYVSVRTDRGVVLMLSSSCVALVASGSAAQPDPRTEIERLEDVVRLLGADA